MLYRCKSTDKPRNVMKTKLNMVTAINHCAA
ncbi:Uncharacterised protein [Vibrio cholerae]|nr:Uncharacterised protein [Vibrio cholerae]CSI81586.1 Uncharacterised protein [Vibrio cholerae]